MEITSEGSCCGILPAQAPLAVPYVPFQPASPERYSAKRGLIRGTLYPCLDLPFMGMVNTDEQSDTPMHELQALGFALQELGLYLDTHQDDAEAAALFQEYSELYRQGKAIYQENCGPLRQADSVVDGEYLWTKSPWPWELSANREG